MKPIILAFVILAFFSCQKIDRDAIVGTWTVKSSVTVNENFEVYSETAQSVYYTVNIFHGDSLYTISSYDTSISVPFDRVYETGEYRFYEDGRVEFDIAYNLGDEFEQYEVSMFYKGTYDFLDKENQTDGRLIQFNWESIEEFEYMVLADMTEYHKYEVNDGAILFSEIFEVVTLSDSEMQVKVTGGSSNIFSGTFTSHTYVQHLTLERQ